jgi:hypothetical protein
MTVYEEKLRQSRRRRRNHLLLQRHTSERWDRTCATAFKQSFHPSLLAISQAFPCESRQTRSISRSVFTGRGDRGRRGSILLLSRRLTRIALGLQPIVDVVPVLVAALLEPAIGPLRDVLSSTEPSRLTASVSDSVDDCGACEYVLLRFASLLLLMGPSPTPHAKRIPRGIGAVSIGPSEPTLTRPAAVSVASHSDARD